MPPSEPAAASSSSSADTAATADGTGTNGRKMGKFRIQPPQRPDPLSSYTVDPILPQSKITASLIEKQRRAPESIEINTTLIRSPFLEPEVPGTQQIRANRSA